MKALHSAFQNLIHSHMRTNLAIAFSLLLGLLSLPQLTQAQICTPDPNAPAVGLFPASVPAGCPGQPYSATLTLGVPSDTLGFPVTNVVVDNITDLPPGITYACEPSNCTFPGGTKGCIVLSGTPTTAGTYLIDVDFTVNSLLPLSGTLTDTLEIVIGYTGTIVANPASCGATDGSATVDFTGSNGTPPYSFVWSDGQTDSVATNLAAGAYTVDVTDASGCTVTFNVSVNSSGGNPPVIDVAQSTIGWSGCAEVDGGFITPSITGGAAPLSFSWSNGETTEDIADLPGGNYTLSVLDADGCLSSETFQVAAPPVLTLSESNVSDVGCFGEADGGATVGVQGGTAPYSFAWSPGGQTVASVTGLAAGTYSVSVEDANNCQKSIDITVEEPEALALIAVANDETVAGANDGSVSAGASGGTPPYTYDWGSAGSGANLSDLAPGEYTITVTDANGCEATETVTVAGATSIRLPGRVEAMQVYPNPSLGRFTLDLSLAQPEAVQVEVYDLQGRSIAQQSAAAATTHQLRLDLGQAPAGTYLLEVSVGPARIHRRLLVE
jgi:hypothetical protein